LLRTGERLWATHDLEQKKQERDELDIHRDQIMTGSKVTLERRKAVEVVSGLERSLQRA
jgi:hypothetical protein